MADPITIRLLGPDDGAVLERVAGGVFDHAVKPERAAAFLAEPSHLMVVALAGDTVVAMASGVVYLHPDKPPQLWINEVGTGDDWRRQGLGRRVTEALLSAGAGRGCRYAWLGTEAENVAARALYRALDGKETENLVTYEWCKLRAPDRSPR